MKKITIEKYVDSTLQSRFDVPAFLIQAAMPVLPQSAITGLLSHGIDLRAMLEAITTNTAYHTAIEVAESQVQKTIHLTIE